jgi:hypothetical protein
MTFVPNKAFHEYFHKLAKEEKQMKGALLKQTPT